MYFSGKVHSVIFENIAQDFYILRMILDRSQPEGLNLEGVKQPTNIVRGYVHGMPVKVGTWFGFEAEWGEHPQYGKQLGVTKAPVLPQGWDIDTASKVLMSAGVGPRIIEDILNYYGDDFLEALNDREKIQAVPGMSPFTAAYVVQRWQTTRAQFLTLDFLNDLGVPQHRIRQIWSVFGDTAHEVLANNPWELVRLDGFTFQEGDAIAERLKLPLTAENPLRVRGAVLYAVRSAKGHGHLFVTTSEILSQVRAMIEGVEDRVIAKAILSAKEDSLVILDKTTRPGVVALYEPWFYSMESKSAEFVLERKVSAKGSRSVQAMLRFCQDVLPTTELNLRGNLENILASPELVGKTQLSATQITGVVNALIEPVSVLTGLPGTGKTTSMVLMVRVLQEAGVKFLLLAPTGIAAKKISSITGSPAYTIHRAFQAEGVKEEEESGYVGVKRKPGERIVTDGSGERWGYDEANPHSAEVILVDESSMVDQHLMYRILSCTRKDARLVFIGDAAQLPSVGPGNVLRDLIASNLFPTVALTEIFRQEDTSDIIHASHDIFNGRIPKTDVRSDFSLVDMSGSSSIEEATLKAIVRLVRALFEKKVNFQVLSPRHAGDVGVTNLNANLREEINPRARGLHEMKIGVEVLREGDRIMVVKNDYDLGIYNGDMGKVNRLDKKNGEVEIKVYGPPVLHVKVPFKKVPTVLRLAYAVTVHKCVHPDTIVETQEGILPIRDICPNGVIATPRGKAYYRGKTINPVCEAVRVTTEDGYSLVVTPEHGLDVWDGVGYSRKESGAILPGDILRMPYGVGCDVDTLARLPDPTSGDVREQVFCVPPEVTSDVAEFLGLFVADGTLFDRGFRLSKRHEDVANRFSELSQQLFGVEPKRFFTLGAHHVEVNSTYLARWLRSIGGLDPNAKMIPKCVLRSPEVIQRKFIRGVIEDGTVNVKNGSLDHIEWSTGFAGIAEYLSVMLLRAGISVSMCSRKGLNYLYIYGYRAALFGERVGFISSFKQKRLQDYKIPRNDREFIPVSETEARALRKTYRPLLGESSCGNLLTRRRMSAWLLSQLEGQSSDLLLSLRDRAVAFHHTVVSSVTPEECESMCVEVPEGHQFRQNGFAGWNSQGNEWDVIIMPIVDSFAHQLQRNLLYTGVTRARQKVILLGTPSALSRAVMNDKEGLRNTFFLDRLLQGQNSLPMG